MNQPLPNVDLLRLLRPSLVPCAELQGNCAGSVRYAPEDGHVPRGWIGGSGPAAGIRLVLVAAEPGDPATGESYAFGDVEATLNQYIAFARRALAEDDLRRDGRPTPFHRNLRRILDLFWAALSLDDQLARTWIIPAVLCSARVFGGAVPKRVENACAGHYLRPILAALPNAVIVALGTKAKTRLRRMGRPADIEAQHPSARANTNPAQSWVAAGERFREIASGP